MASLHDHYTYRLTWSEEDQEHVGLCVELPGLSWLAESPEKALVGIRQLVSDTIREMQENAEQPPEPMATKHYSGKFLVRVPPETHRSLALQAAEAGISLNRLIASKLQGSA